MRAGSAYPSEFVTAANRRMRSRGRPLCRTAGSTASSSRVTFAVGASTARIASWWDAQPR
jgi:hypothetical protein